MDATENQTGQQTPFKEPENGVAPHSGSSEPEKRNCDWLCHHQTGWQVGEQGVLAAIFDAINGDIPEEHRWCVEFGAGDGVELPLTCDLVLRRKGWRGLLIDCQEKNIERLRRVVPPLAHAIVGWVHPTDEGKTIDDYMERVGCPQTPGLMVIDLDSIDFHIAKAMKARPYVLCIEHHDLICPLMNDEPFAPILEDAGRTFKVPGVGGYFNAQANSKALDLALPGLGYTLVFRTRFNSIFARSDIVGKIARPADTAIRLNIGAGPHNDRRYIAIDIKEGVDARKLPYADNSVDEVYSAHLLEHFPFTETDAILAEWTRVLKPGGIMRIAVPDAKKMAEMVLKSDEEGLYREIEMFVYGGHINERDVHHAMFTERGLRERLGAAGIGQIKRFSPFIVNDCASYKHSLNLEGVKRWRERKEKPRICLILSQPRFTFTGHEIALLELARKMDFTIQTCTGSFWDRDMTMAILNARANFNPDFLLFSDYDSVFEPEDAKKLIDAMQNDPQMAAIVAVQMSRHHDRPLVMEDKRDYSGELTRVDFGHFGLTLIDATVFDDLPKPYFWSIPGRDENGEWDWDAWNKTDADITFWRNMKMMGHRVYQHNGVCIGHITQCVKYPRDKGRGVQLIPIENYWKAGKPKDALFNQECFKPKPPVNEAPAPTPEGTT